MHLTIWKTRNLQKDSQVLRALISKKFKEDDEGDSDTSQGFTAIDIEKKGHSKKKKIIDNDASSNSLIH